MCDGRMVALLLEHGADPDARWNGVSAYALARVFGNAEAANLLAEAGADTRLDGDEVLLAAAAEDRVPGGARIDPDVLKGEYRDLPGRPFAPSGQVRSPAAADRAGVRP